MVDYADSSQLNLWLLDSPEELQLCRSKANFRAREYLYSLLETKGLNATAPEPPGSGSGAGSSASLEQPVSTSSSAQSSAPSTKVPASAPVVPIEQFACGFAERSDRGCDLELNGYSTGPWESPTGRHDEKGNTHSYLTVQEEQILVSFYVSKLPSLIGPQAQIPRLRRESKVTATAALLTRRFFLSNSVMLHDPKTVLVAAAFLGSKVEDSTADVRSLEEGTALMNAPVTKDAIIPAEVALLAGTHFDLLCFHPYKTVLAITEDLRTYLKSEQGKGLVTIASSSRSENDNEETQGSQSMPPLLSGQDLKPMYDTARLLLDDVIISDLPLLFNPGHVGLASLVVAQEQVLQQDANLPRIDLPGYMRQRFDQASQQSSEALSWLDDTLPTICRMLGELKQGLWGCGKYDPDLTRLKAIHKKLKKVRLWGVKETATVKKRNRDAVEAHADDSSTTEGARKKPKKQ